MFKDQPNEELPREKLMTNGVSALTNSDLLALIIRTGTSKRNVLETSKTILSTQSLDELAHAPFAEISQLLGRVKACQIVAAFELGRRALSAPYKKNIIRCSRDAAHLLMPELAGKKQEHFIVLLLDTRLNLLKIETLFLGTLNSSLVHPREIFRLAIRNSASALILIHNHPSGNCEPSEEDIHITTIIQKAGKLVGIRVLDHVIIAGRTYSSMKERGLI
ncbi:MAG: DNA repair protein RadC [Nanoarchaeota archaeon]